MTAVPRRRATPRSKASRSASPRGEAHRQTADSRSTGDAGLTRERVVAEALARSDEDGLAAFSLRELARRLDVYPTAIYWHVPGRNALLAAVVAMALRDIRPRGDPRDWQAWIAELLHGFRGAMRAHPNIAPLIGAQLVSNAAIDADLIEDILGALRHAGFGDERIVGAYNTVIAAMSGFATMEFAPLPQDEPVQWAQEQARRVRELGSSLRPNLSGLMDRLENRAFILRWQNGRSAPLDDSFAAYVDCVVQGMQQMVR